MDYLLEKIALTSNLNRPEGKAEAVGRLAPLLLAIEDPVIREGYSSRAAGRLGLRLETLETTLRRRAPRRVETQQPGQLQQETTEAPGPEPSRTEQNLLYILFQKTEQWNLLQAVDPEWFQSRELKTLFEKYYELQKDIREGGDPPESIFSLCESTVENVWMSRILMLPTQRFEGEVVGYEREMESAFLLQIHKMRRQYEERRKRELKQDAELIRADDRTESAPLMKIHQISKDIIARHTDLLDRSGGTGQ